MEKADEEVVQRLEEIRADHQSVPGVAELLGIVETQMSSAHRIVPALKAQAHALPMGNAETYFRLGRTSPPDFAPSTPRLGICTRPKRARWGPSRHWAAFQEEAACTGILF